MSTPKSYAYSFTISGAMYYLVPTSKLQLSSLSKIVEKSNPPSLTANIIPPNIPSMNILFRLISL